MGSRIGLLKTAAKRLGMEPVDYLRKIEEGYKHCTKCKTWKPTSDFGSDRTRGDGLAARCRACHQTTDKPGKILRRTMHARGFDWCRGCRAWLAMDVMAGKQGACRECVNRERRERYAKDQSFRYRMKQHTYSRKRLVDAVPPEGETHLLMVFNGECAYCGSPATAWDHFDPVSKGGKTTPDNILPVCKPCNSSKKDQNPFKWMDKMGIIPSTTLIERLAHFKMDSPD